MSGRNENSSEQEYSDSTSELEEDITTLLSDIGMEPYKCEPKRKSVEPQVSSRAGSLCGVIVINVIARKERSPICAVKKLPFLAVKSLP